MYQIDATHSWRAVHSIHKRILQAYAPISASKASTDQDMKLEHVITATHPATGVMSSVGVSSVLGCCLPRFTFLSSSWSVCVACAFGTIMLCVPANLDFMIERQLLMCHRDMKKRSHVHNSVTSNSAVLQMCGASETSDSMHFPSLTGIHPLPSR